MPTPSEQQRKVHEREVRDDFQGVDLANYHIQGWWKRGIWHRRGIAAAVRGIVQARDAFSELNDGDLNDKLKSLRDVRLANPCDLGGSLEEGLAALAVAADRELGLAAYEVQLMASVALARGFLTEVDTGEGKTLALALTAAFQGWTGRPCHVITANDYLAERDASQLNRFYKRVGLTVAHVTGETSEMERRHAYACDVTYTTSKEVAADYLRDRLRLGGIEESGSRLSLARQTSKSRDLSVDPVQRGLYFALLDEADNALIDEAVTPLIISRSLEPGELEIACSAAWDAAKSLMRGADYDVNLSRKSIEFLPGKLIEKVEQWKIPGSRLWSGSGRRAELLRLAVEAREFFHRDQQYVVEDQKVVIVDESTGRRMPMRSWRQGLHQMIEAKENVPLSGVTETIARTSFQAYFRRYETLAGASGTVREVAREIWGTYGLPTLRIPRHLPCQRQHIGVRFHPDLDAKFRAVTAEVRSRHGRDQPVLIGVRSVESSELLEGLFLEANLSSQVINARRHQDEATMISLAGNQGRITIATNMAGRGTDILLGHGVIDLGGLHVVATEPHESARVDRQFYGRSGRQGDPGSVLSIYSVEDPLFGRFLSAKLLKLWGWMLSGNGRFIDSMGQEMGRILLKWCQYRAQSQAVRSRLRVMKSETEIRGGLGFAKGRKQRPGSDVNHRFPREEGPNEAGI